MRSETALQGGHPSPAEEPKSTPTSEPSLDDPRLTVTWSAPDARAEPGTPLPAAFGDYLIIKRIAGGGMGVVYKAVHQKLHRTVALKLIRAGQLASDEEISRFHVEAEAAAQLDHPGIVPLYEVGEHQGQQFLAMSFVDGGSLAERLKAGPLPGREAARLVQRVAEAVAYAHAHGIIHRDLKPGNILLDGDGQPRITDFGLAKNVHGDSNLTVAGQVVGTPSYMPPEQASGEADRVAPAADVYSLGAVLYCLLTGRPPFQAATVMETLKQVTEQEPVPPRRLNSSIDRDLETICLKCLQKSPKIRYDSAGALAEDLRRFQNNEPILARPVGRLERFRRWCRRNPLVAALAAGVVAVLLLGTGISSYWALRANRKENEAREAQALSERRLYDAEINLAFQAWKDSRIAVAQELLQRQVPRNADAADHRDFEWHYLQRLCQLSNLHTLKGHSGAVWKVAYSADGRRLASSGVDGTVRIWDAVTWGPLFTLRGHTAPVPAVSFSPTGSRLVSADAQGFIKIWDAATGKVLLSWKAHAARVHDLAFSPDGRQIASASDDNNVGLGIWDANTGKALRTLSRMKRVLCVAYSPDGQSLASGGSDGLKLWDVDTGRQRQTFRLTNRVDCLAYSTDGRWLVAGGNYALRVWNPLSGELLHSFRGHTHFIQGVAFSPDSRRIASCSHDQTIRVWDLVADAETLTLRHPNAVHGLAFRPDGCFLASAGGDGTVRIWDATKTEMERFVLPGHQGTILRLAYRPDGQQFASSADGSRGEIRIWDADKRHAICTLRSPDRYVTSIAYSADNRWLAASLGQVFIQGKPAPAQIKVWDAATGTDRGLLPGHADFICSLTFGPDGRLASSSNDKTIKIWDVDTMQLLQTLLGHAATVRTVAFSRDGRLASGSVDRTVRIWDLKVGQEPVAVIGQPAEIGRLEFSPSGKELACTCGDSVTVWDTMTMETKLVLKVNQQTFDLAYSPSGQRMAAVDAAGIKIWDARTGIELVTLPGGYTNLSFSSDGTGLIAALGSSLHFWDTRPLTAELREEYEARAVVRFHSARSMPQAELLRSIREDPLLRESVRARALALAEDHLDAAVAH